MANAFFAELNNVDVDAPTLSDKEKDCIIQHLIFSSNIKYLWKYGDAIIEGIFNSKRKRSRLLFDRLLKRISRMTRRLGRYEILRSCLEGLLFDQIDNLSEHDHFEIKALEGVEGADFMLTQVYFSTHTWDSVCAYQRHLEFDNCEEITTFDYMKILHFAFKIEHVIEHVTNYVKTHALEDHPMWSKRVLRCLHTIKKKHQLIMKLLNTTPEPFVFIE